MRYEVTKELETGNSIIDREHSQLFDAVNNLMDACSMGKGRSALEPTIKFLLDYVDKHFAHEESLQKQSGYSDFQKHKKFHEGYKMKLKDIVSKISSNGPAITDVSAINQHIGTLITHIKIEDKKLGAFLNGKNVK